MYHGRFKNTHYQAGFHWGEMLRKHGNFIHNQHTFQITEERKKFAMQCLPVYEKYYPEVLEEIKGIAEGQQSSYENLCTFLLSMYCFEFSNHCTCFAFRNREHIIFGRNSDFLIDLEKLYMNFLYQLDGTDCSAEEFSLQVNPLIRCYKRWKPEAPEEKCVTGGALVINAFRQKIYWDEKEISVVKREFDFLYLLASTPGRVYTYSQIYQLVWQECSRGDLKNTIYCMVYRLKRKLKKVDKSTADIICSVKDVGYCLKVDKR